MNATENLKDVIFEMECNGQEVSVLICGQVTKGADAARDDYGRPTECATPPDAFATFILINRKEYTDREAASLFDMTVEEWDERCKEELIEALDRKENLPETEDDIWF